EVDGANWHLEISGLLKIPRTLSLADIKARKRRTVTATLECSGNSSNPGFMGAIGNIRWTGTPLAPLLRECHPLDRAIEVVFFGADEKVEKIRDKDYLQNFARSLSLRDAMKRDDILLAYEMNGQPLEKDHWAPLQLDKKQGSKYSWTFWSYDWKNSTPGEHTLVSRAMDAEGRVQPSADEPEIKLKRTYWEANQQWVRKIRI